jgi:uncharacterized protein YyaL (SSP411 family)
LLLAVAGALLLARVAAGFYERAHPPVALDRVAWVGFDVAEAQARATHKPLLYDFSAAWCPPCRAMEREVFADEEEAKLISDRFVPVRMIDRRREDGRNSAVMDSLQSAYGVTGFPTLVVVFPETGRHASMSGYSDKDKTIRFLANPTGKPLKSFIFGAGADSTK